MKFLILIIFRTSEFSPIIYTYLVKTTYFQKSNYNLLKMLELRLNPFKQYRYLLNLHSCRICSKGHIISKICSVLFSIQSQGASQILTWNKFLERIFGLTKIKFDTYFRIWCLGRRVKTPELKTQVLRFVYINMN